MIAKGTAPRASGDAGRMSAIALPSRVRPLVLAILLAGAGLVLLARAF